MALNCWEFKDCGRGPEGARGSFAGVCPAAKEYRLDGANDGVAAGRACWVVAGTMCGGRTQGTFVDKCGSCLECDFFSAVIDEEGREYQAVPVLVARLF